VHVCSSVCRTHTEYDLRKMFETSTMISKGVDTKCTTAGVQFETIPDSPMGIFKFKCLIMKSVCQFLHVVQAHGLQILQQWWCNPPMWHLIIMVEARLQIFPHMHLDQHRVAWILLYLYNGSAASISICTWGPRPDYFNYTASPIST
jgi:hypothetical protein